MSKFIATIAGFSVAAALGIGATTVKPYPGPTIYVRNTSAVLASKDVENALPAIQAAVDKDFAPIWGVRAKLVYIGAKTAPKGSEVILLQDGVDPKVQDALGYHFLVSGKAYAKVFLGLSLAYHYAWTGVFTHELFEMLVDPDLIRTFQQPDGTIYAGETADPVESQTFGYTRKAADGTKVLISDFVTPRWFGAAVPGPFDFTKNCQSAGEILNGGYAQIWDGLKWTVIYGTGAK